ERVCGNGKVELGGEGERLVRSLHRLRVAGGNRVESRLKGVGLHELAARRFRLEQLERLGERPISAGIAESAKEVRELCQRPPRGKIVAAPAVFGERLFEGGARLVQPALCRNRPRPALQEEG